MMHPDEFNIWSPVPTPAARPSDKSRRLLALPRKAASSRPSAPHRRAGLHRSVLTDIGDAPVDRREPVDLFGARRRVGEILTRADRARWSC